jgi:sugar (pentulose or hexulose) kinase
MRPNGILLGMGIDVGTQGVRVIVAGSTGRVYARAHEAWPLQPGDSDYREQNPAAWWDAIKRCVRRAVSEISEPSSLVVSVTATSGTLVLADANMLPVRPAIMWNDKRARTEARSANEAFEKGGVSGAAVFRPTSALPKAMWVRSHEPDVWEQVRHVLSAGDWILARLRRTVAVTDYTNALKFGYDLEVLRWPGAIEGLGIPHSYLPTVVRPGTALGQVSPAVCEELDLPKDTTVIAGVTDANAAQVAAGAVDPGDWVTTIGTGLSIKGVSAVRLDESNGSLYSHRHWASGWIPSATSHCGTDSIGLRFPGANLAELTAKGRVNSPSSVLVLPLATVGEFFPFHAPQAQGFEVGRPTSQADLFRGYLEGIAYIERLSMERMGQMGAPATGTQLTMGGGAANTDWIRLRATVLGRSVARPVETSSAFGAAIIALAASPERISATAKRMVTVESQSDPEDGLMGMYEDRYFEFIEELSARGYIDSAAPVSVTRTGEEHG